MSAVPALHGLRELLVPIDPDWDCPWPLDWQRHYRVLADLADADGQLPDIAPGVLMDGDDIGKWLQQQKQPGTWTQLLPQQQERLTVLGVKPLRRPPHRRARGRRDEVFSRLIEGISEILADLAEPVSVR